MGKDPMVEVLYETGDLGNIYKALSSYQTMKSILTEIHPEKPVSEAGEEKILEITDKVLEDLEKYDFGEELQELKETREEYIGRGSQEV